MWLSELVVEEGIKVWTATVGEVGRWVRNLYLVAMGVFLVTIVIGIVNGLDIYEFDRNQLLTHVHSGTLGWITLGIVASAMWLTRAADRRLAISLAILIPIYVAAFSATWRAER